MSQEGKVDIIKPKVDDREYEYVILENGIKVVTVSHPDSEVSAASLRLSSGMFQDPDDVLGLAHFVEHMLFMGTDRYPEEKEFHEFVKTHGGTYNGYTSNASTCYFFEVEATHFLSALDRFSSFFVCPTLKEDGVQRELNAVHSEHEVYLTNDMWREYQILKNLAEPTKHPFCRFGVGNRSTLDIPDIHDRVLKFYEEHYSSNQMTLVIYGSEKTEVLQEYAKKYFSEVKNKELPKRVYGGPIFHAPTMQYKCHYVIPVKESRVLKLFFPLPHLNKDYRTTMIRLIGHLIGHESEGSLYHHLKKKGWLTSLSAGNWHKWDGLTLFTCHMEMSIEGEKHIDEIIMSFFEYVSFAKNMPVSELKRLFDEKKRINNQLVFQYQDKNKPSWLVPGLSESLYVARPEDLLMHSSYCFFDFDEQKFREEMSKLDVSQMMCMWVSNTHTKLFEEDASTFQTEPYFDSKYRSVDLSPKLIDNIKKIKDHPPHFFAPVPNIFIPENLDVLKFDNDEVKKTNLLPRKVFSDDKLTVYYKQDTQFNRPKSIYFIRLHLSSAPKSVKSQLCQEVFSKLVEDALNEITYFASLTRISFRIRGDLYGMFIRCEGWNDSLPKLLEVIMEYVQDFGKLFDEKRYVVIKDEVVKEHANKRKDLIIWSALRISDYAIHCDETHFFEEFIEVGENLQYDDVVKYYHDEMMKGCLKVETLCCANDSEKKIVDMLRKQTVLNDDQMKSFDEIYQHRIIKLKPGGLYVIARKTTNAMDKNSCLVYNVQIGIKNEKDDIISYLLSMVLSTDVFDELRTKQQLGYIVGMRFLEFHNVKYAQFYIQSADVHPVDISQRLQKFIGTYLESLEKKMTEEYFKEQVHVMIKKYEEKPKNLTEEGNSHWKEVTNRTLRFGRKEQYAKILREGKVIGIPDVLDFFKRNFLSEELKVEFEVQIFSEKYQDQMKELNKEHCKEERYSEDIQFLRKQAESFFPSFVPY